MIVLDILLGLLVVIGALVGLVLLVPIHYHAAGALSEDAVWWRARLAWGFGILSLHAGQRGIALRLIGLRIWRWRRDDTKPSRARARKKDKKADDTRTPRARRGLRWMFARRRVIARVAGRYLRALHLKGGVSGVIGLSGPDQTAALHQVLSVLHAMVPEGVVDVELDWVEEVVDLEADVGGWVWPIQVVGLTLRLWLDRETWRALRAA